MKKYSKPEVEILKIQADTVFTASGDGYLDLEDDMLGNSTNPTSLDEWD